MLQASCFLIVLLENVTYKQANLLALLFIIQFNIRLRGIHVKEVVGVLRLLDILNYIIH